VVETWGLVLTAVSGLQLVFCLILHLFVRRMPTVLHIASMGTLISVLLLGVGVLGVVASLKRTRPLLNGHLMCGLLVLVLALSFTSTAKRDIELHCNIVQMELNLHVAEQAVHKMHNKAIMESISTRMRELDKHLLEVDENAHSQKKAKDEAEQHIMDDYYLLHGKVNELRRHATTLQQQVAKMIGWMKALENNETEVHEEDIIQAIKEGTVELPKRFQQHLDHLNSMVKAADAVLEKAKLPSLQTDHAGKKKPELSLSGKEYREVVKNLAMAAEDIADLEADLEEELGHGPKLNEVAKHHASWKRQHTKRNWNVYNDDYEDYSDYHRFHDYMDDYNEEHGTSDLVDAVWDLHGETNKVEEKVDRFKENKYKHHELSDHGKKLSEAREARAKRREIHNSFFEKEMDKAEREHTRMFDQWDRTSSTCTRSNSVVPQLVGVSLIISLLQLASSYMVLSLIFRLPTKRSQ